MGNSNSAVCRSTDGRVEANPDVAGIGVFVSFAASTVLVFLAVLYGYITDSLPETTLTRLDYYLLSDLPKGLGPTLESIEDCKYAVTAWLKRRIPEIFGPYSYRVYLQPEELRKRRKDNLERFVLSLGDQQLVTGLAVLIAGYSQMSTMSAYHFNIVASLAWFSSATHLATLAVLKNYFREHTTVRNWRVCIMLVLLLMLVVAQIPGWVNKDNSVPVICNYQDLDRRDMLTVSTAIGFLLITYTEGIARLYTRDIDWNLPDRCIERMVKLLSPCFFTARYRRPSYLDIIQESQFPGEISDRDSVAIIRVEREKGRFARFESNMESSRGLIERYALATVFMGRELAFSFFITMALLVADLTYGFVQVFEYRASFPPGGIEGNQNEISFGQLVPLLLLLLPIFTMGEIHSENHEIKNSLSETEPTSVAKALVLTGIELGEFTNSTHAYGDDTNEQCNMDDATADESPSATQSPKTIQNAHEAADYSTSLKTFLDSLESATKTVAEDRSDGLIDLECMDFTPPKRVWTGFASRGAQDFEDQRLVPSSTASHDPRAPKVGQDRTAWSAPSPSVNIYEIPSAQHLRRASSRSFESADDPDNKYHSKIKYKFILWAVIAVQFPYQIMVALAVAGVFGSHKSSTASFFLYSFFGAAFLGIGIGVFQRMKEIKR